jgi:predicted Zn-dependent peptidase
MPVPVVEFSDERLANGLRLIVAEDHLAPVVAVHVWYDVGSRHEAAGKTGFAHLFEHVMFQGSAHVGKGEHFALINSVGGTLNGTTWLDRTEYHETVPSHELELVLWLEADRMGTLLDALSQDNLDNQRDVVKNEKRQSYDNRPYGAWLHKLLGHVFPPGHPYHHPTIGSMEDLDAASLEDVRSFFTTYYAPNNAVVAVVGDCERAQVREWADRYFGPIPAYPVIPPAPEMALPPVIGSEIRETIEDRVPLTRVYLGFRAPAFGDDRFDALDVATSLLSGSKSSRLQRRLVREERLAQDVVISMVPGVGGASICVGWATVRPGVDPAAVEAAYLDELAKLAAEPPTDDEMTRTMALAEADELGALARVDERAERLATFATYFDRPGMINDVLSRYLAVTPERVRAAAAEVFRADNRVVLTYVPAPPGAAGEEWPVDEGDDVADELEADA